MKKSIILALLFQLVFSSCTMVYRSIRYWTPDINEYKAFPQVEVESGSEKYTFHEDTSLRHQEIMLFRIKGTDTLSKFTLDEYLKASTTTAFIIIRNDTILYEKYYHGYSKDDKSCYFSVTKSITALLVGIAVDEGLISSVNDPITKYIPELEKGHHNFKGLTIEHLLNMEAGLDFNESYVNPFTGMARLFYGRNQMKQLSKLSFIRNPGETMDYNSATTALLGIALERATKKSYAEYLEEKVWKPIGMEFNASVSLDDRKHQSAKSYSGLNATARDLAKIGKLFVNNGSWNGTQIVSENWVEKSSTPDIEEGNTGIKYKGYQYHWWNRYTLTYDSTGNYKFTDLLSALNHAERMGYQNYKAWETDRNEERYWSVFEYHPQYYAQGIMNQLLFIDPERNTIIVRLGKDWDWEYNYIHLMNSIAKRYPVVKKI